MTKIILVILLVIFIIGFVYVAITLYNKMVTLTNSMTRDYHQLNMVVQEQLYLVQVFFRSYANINYNAFQNLKGIIESFDNQGNIKHVIDTSIGIDNEINKLIGLVSGNNVVNWINSYNEVKIRLNRAKEIYNKNVDAFNKLINFPLINILAKKLGYRDWPRF